ncbi:MAG: ATP-binding protein [Planctomycetota bacterium]|nr:ATP-binding protein [Planctomycetota bacterium]
MRAGKIASLLLAGLLGTVSAVVAVLALHYQGIHERLHKTSELFEIVMIALILSLTILLILFPVGASVDRAVKRLQKNIEGGGPGKPIPDSRSEPRWLQPLMGAFAAAVDRFQEERLALRNELQDVRIRHDKDESRRRHSEAVLHVLHDAVIVTDANNHLTMANEAAVGLLELDPERSLHRPIDEVIGIPELCMMIRDTCNAGEIGVLHHEEVQVPLISSDRSGGAVSTTSIHDACLICVEHPNDIVGGVVTILHDMTKEREFIELKTDFISKASHELHTPLSSIQAYIEMLIDGEANNDASRQEFYRIIFEEADRLGRLIENLLNISRIEAGMTQIQLEHVKVSALVDRVLAAQMSAANEKNITIDIRLQKKVDHLEADRDMISQVLLNLLDNAIKHTPDGGRIELRIEEDVETRRTRVSVVDNGPGIPKQALTRIFEKFYRIDTDNPESRGGGLGLTLCKHIVETLHQGTIGVESEPGQGARFWFSIPHHRLEERAAA